MKHSPISTVPFTESILLYSCYRGSVFWRYIINADIINQPRGPCLTSQSHHSSVLNLDATDSAAWWSRYHTVLGWGRQNKFNRSVAIRELFSELSQQCFPIGCHVHIWLVSAQLSRIWMQISGSIRYLFGKREIPLKEKQMTLAPITQSLVFMSLCLT